MSVLIKLEDAILAIKRYGVGCFDQDEFSPEQCERFVINLLEKIPPANAREVITCCECDWWMKQKDSQQGPCALSGTCPTGAWYCASARRKNEDKIDDCN